VGEELFAAFEVRVAVLKRVGLAGDLGVEYSRRGTCWVVNRYRKDGQAQRGRVSQEDALIRGCLRKGGGHPMVLAAMM
jgi:hypothetical protein